MRLDKMLANSGYGTRSEVRKLIMRGFVRVNGNVVKDISFSVTESDKTEIGSTEVSAKTYLYYKLDKPDGYLTAMEDKRLPTVADLIPDNLKTKKLSPVGRLDYHTTGLLIITNDGELSHRLTSPKYEVKKTYLIEYEGEPLTDEHVNIFAEGFSLEDTGKKTELRPSVLNVFENNKCELTITEGKTHQVRRMLAKFNRSVVALRRVRIGNIVVPEGKEGILEEFTEDELQELMTILSIKK